MRSMKLALALLGACAVAPAFAQDYPTKQVTIVVAYPAGGAVDAVGRVIAQRLSDALGKSVIVDNRSGASGNIGAQFVARSPADGHTLLLAPLTSYAMNATLFPEAVGYRLDKDFTGIALVGYLPLVLLVNEAVPATTPAQLVALAKAKPGSLSFASSGNGSIEQVAGEMFKGQAGVSMVHIPYRGAAPAITDLMGGQVQVMFATAATAVPNLKTGKLRPLLTTTAERLGALPDVPTAREAGFPGFEVASTYALLAPAGTPPAVVRRLNQEVTKLMRLPEIRQHFNTLGIEAMTSTPEEANARTAAELGKWGKAIRDAGIKAE